jgi:ABC-type glycerol-3-phosphate transport system substrate-binding protein
MPRKARQTRGAPGGATRLTTIAVALVVLLAACGGNSSEIDNPTTAPAQDGATTTAEQGESPATTEAPEQGAGGTVTVWSWATGAEQEGIEAAFVPLFEEARPDATVEFVFVPRDSFVTTLVAAAGAQDGPDVVIGAAGDFPTMQSAGALADITTLWEAYEEKDQYQDQFLVTVDGAVYGVRTKGETVALWYNKDILDEIGVDVPTTRDELAAAFSAAHEAGYTALGMCGQPTTGCEYMALPWLSGEGWDYAQPDESALAAGLSVIEDWVTAGYIPRDAVTWDQNISFQQFLAGEMAFVQSGNWNIETARADANFEFGVVPIPGGTEESTSYLGGEVAYLGAFSDDVDLAWDFLTSTFLSYDGQMAAFESTGSVPAREDASHTPNVTDDPLQPPFLEQLAKASPNPPLGVDALKVPEAQLIIGQYWSAVIGQQITAEGAAQEAVPAVEEALGQ